MSEMIEQVARAILRETDGKKWERASELSRQIATDAARAAINAMRSVTPVVRVSWPDPGVVHELRGSPADVWAALLDAALEP